MQYLLLIYDDERARASWTAEQNDAFLKEYYAFTKKVKEAGVYVASAPLEPIATATTVRVRGGEGMVTDGPFAETKEQLGGFYLVDCEDLDAALGFAAQIPSARTGSIEVRPILVH